MQLPRAIDPVVFDGWPYLVDHVDELINAHVLEADPNERVILTGEYTPFNLLVERDAGGWQLSGMIDFADAMVGRREYDFLGPSLFSCEGDPLLVAALFRGYHGAERPLDHALRMQLLALALLHRFANFDKQIRIPHWRDRVSSLEQLAVLIWPERRERWVSCTTCDASGADSVECADGECEIGSAGLGGEACDADGNPGNAGPQSNTWDTTLVTPPIGL